MSARRLCLALAAALVAVAAGSIPALAHALLVRSIPEANAELLRQPAAIEMWFSEPLESAFTDARLIGPDARQVPTGAILIDGADPTHITMALGELAPGIYTVTWQTLSQVDGHEWFGSFPFTLLNPDGSQPAGGQAVEVIGERGDLPSLGEAIARWLTLVPSMLIFGGTVIQLLVIRRNTPLAERALTNLTRLIWLAAAAVVSGTILQLALQAQRLGGANALLRLVLETRTGQLGLIRIILVTVLGLAATELQRESRMARLLRLVLPLASFLFLVPLAATEDPAQAALWLSAAVLALAPLAIFRRPDAQLRAYQALLIGSSALLLSFSTASHAGAVAGSAFAMAADLLHLIAASIWFSGIAALTLLWAQADGRSWREELLPSIKRFSTIAGGTVYVIALTGVFSSLVELPNLDSLWITPYGRVLIVKLVLVGIAWALAFANHRRVQRQPSSERLPRAIALEAGVAVGVLAAVAFLVQTPTPRSLNIESGAPAAPLPYNNIAAAADLNVHLQVNPNQAGQNRFWVHLYRDDASEIGEVQLVRLFFEHLDRQFGRASADLEALGQDTFAVEGAYLSQPGQWQIQVYVRRRGLDDLLSPVQLEVPPPTTRAASGPFSNPAPGIPPLALLGALSIAVGATPFLWPRLTESRYPRAFAAAGGLLIALGIFGLTRGLLNTGVVKIPLAQRINPIPPSAESLARGEEIYEQSCAICHGASGRGDGPVGVTLLPRPSDFAIHMPPGIHTDGQLLEWISNGFANTAMPAFRDSYSEEDLWHVINFIRTFAPNQGDSE